MLNKKTLFVVACLMLGMAVVVFGQQRAPIPQKPDNPQSLVHVDAAKKLVGNDPFLTRPFNFYCIPGNARANSQTAPDLEPIKIFDNVYAIGNSETTVYVLPTSDGIVLIDSGFENKVESTLLPHPFSWAMAMETISVGRNTSRTTTAREWGRQPQTGI